MVLFFSGTGNSKYVAQKIAAATDQKIISINDRIREKDFSKIECEDRLVFVTPTYSWRVPRIVFEWISKTEFSIPAKVWFVMTCGGEIGNSEKYNIELCNLKNFEYMGTYQIKMPDNYIVMFTLPNKDRVREICKEAKPEIEQCTELIKSDSCFPKQKSNVLYNFYSGLVNDFFYKKYVKADGFTADGKCIGCGKCESLCPLGNITLKDRKPVWGENCTQCMSCISYCPTEAIEYGKKTRGKQRYHFDFEME